MAHPPTRQRQPPESDMTTPNVTAPAGPPAPTPALPATLDDVLADPKLGPAARGMIAAELAATKEAHAAKLAELTAQARDFQTKAAADLAAAEQTAAEKLAAAEQTAAEKLAAAEQTAAEKLASAAAATFAATRRQEMAEAVVDSGQRLVSPEARTFLQAQVDLGLAVAGNKLTVAELTAGVLAKHTYLVSSNAPELPKAGEPAPTPPAAQRRTEAPAAPEIKPVKSALAMSAAEFRAHKIALVSSGGSH